MNPSAVADVGQGIGVKKHQVGESPRAHRAELSRPVEVLRAGERCRPERFCRRQARLHQLAQLIVNGGTGQDEGVSRVGADHDLHPCPVGFVGKRESLGVEIHVAPASRARRIPRDHAVSVLEPRDRLGNRDVL
jgi:hypothetical protein